MSRAMNGPCSVGGGTVMEMPIRRGLVEFMEEKAVVDEKLFESGSACGVSSNNYFSTNPPNLVTGERGRN